MPLMNRLVSDTRFAVVIGIAVTVTAAVYVAFGPPTLENNLTANGSRRKKSRRRRFSGEPRGLHNAGNTCFVNAILQATAACPTMLLWLEERKEDILHLKDTQIKSQEEKDESALDDCPKIDDSASILQLALLRVLRVANGLSGLNDDEDSSEGDGVDPEIWAPASLFRALRAHRWVINTDEQDAHEFFQVLLSTVEEELQRKPKTGPTSLFDTTEIENSLSNDEQSENTNPNNCDGNYSQTNEKSNANSEIETELCLNNDDASQLRSRCLKRQNRQGRRKTNSRSSSGVFVRSGEELSMENVIKQTKLASSSATPFTGTLTNKLSFRGSGKCKSPTSSTIFNNITLSLPNSGTQSVSNTYSWVSGVTAPPVALETLLQMYVSVEVVSSGSNSKTDTDSVNQNGQKDLVKQLTFARLPDCICFHIQRTAFESGVPRKRNDPVLFPSVLNMDNYVYNRQISKRKMLGQASATETVQNDKPTTPESYVQTPLGAETPSYASSSWLMSPDDDNSLMLSSVSSTFPDMSKYTFNNNYSLRAVVVHLGAIDSGHYVTYRREPQTLCPNDTSAKPKWFYTSDSVVREVTIEEVLNTNPYMLFYERTSEESNTTQDLDSEKQKQ